MYFGERTLFSLNLDVRPRQTVKPCTEFGFVRVNRIRVRSLAPYFRKRKMYFKEKVLFRHFMIFESAYRFTMNKRFETQHFPFRTNQVRGSVRVP